MKTIRHYDLDSDKRIEMPNIDNFINDVLDICKKHRMSISHEDTHGAFIIVPYNEEMSEWLREAMVEKQTTGE